MANKDFIVADQQVADELQAMLSRNPAFKDAEQFVMLYNSGILQAANSSVKQAADLLKKAYSNVTLQGKAFIVKSMNEDSLEKALFMLRKYTLVSALKRVAETMAEAGYSEDTCVFFSTGKDVGCPVLLNEETHKYEVYPGSEKLFKDASELASNPYLMSILNDFSPSGDDLELTDGLVKDLETFIVLRDILALDDSFVTEIGEIIEKRIDSN